MRIFAAVPLKLATQLAPSTEVLKAAHVDVPAQHITIRDTAFVDGSENCGYRRSGMELHSAPLHVVHLRKLGLYPVLDFLAMLVAQNLELLDTFWTQFAFHAQKRNQARYACCCTPQARCSSTCSSFAANARWLLTPKGTW